MKTLLSLIPTSGVYRMSDFDLAQVDSWVSFATTNVEIPIDALNKTTAVSGDTYAQITQSIKTDLGFALAVINNHMKYSTYIVGEQASAADIALVCALYYAADAELWDPTNTTDDIMCANICRWYNTVLHQDFFQKALDQLSSTA